MRRLVIVPVSFGVICAVLGLTANRVALFSPGTPSSAASKPNMTRTPKIDIGKYKALQTELENQRAALSSRYQRATVQSEKISILSQARETFVVSVDEKIFPHWYGTPWDFYGTTEIPNEGKIACGYFVSTVLRDVGMRVQRVRLAQQASENIILSLTTNEHVKRFRQVPIDQFVAKIKDWGPGLYVVGLDNHVGFIVNRENDITFVHSSYVDPLCVMKENAVDSRILAASQYRVLGKLSEDDQLLLKWLHGSQFSTRGR